MSEAARLSKATERQADALEKLVAHFVRPHLSMGWVILRMLPGRRSQIRNGFLCNDHVYRMAFDDFSVLMVFSQGDYCHSEAERLTEVTGDLHIALRATLQGKEVFLP